MTTFTLPARAATALAVLGLLAGCAAPRAGHGSGAGPGGGAYPGPVPTTGLLPAPQKVTDRLVLSRTRVTAGQRIKGALVVTYRGSRPLNLTRTCQPQFAAVLANRRFPPQVAFATICITAPFLIKPGETRFGFTLGTTAPACARPGQSARRLPRCLPPPQVMPPLPAGRYWAVLIGDGLALPPPTPVAVTVLPARSG